MQEVILKPKKSKIIVSWLVMSTVVLVFSLVLNPGILSDFVMILIVLVYLFGACLVFNLIFYNLPFFKVHLTQTHFIGPDFPGLGWRQTEIPLEEVDLARVNSALRWLGYYIIKTKRSNSIALWAFDETQYQQFTDIVSTRAKAIQASSAETIE